MSSAVTVAHFTKTFLPITEGWIYDQVRLVRGYRSIILATRRANSDQFPWDRLYTVEELSHVQRMREHVLHMFQGFYPVLGEMARREGVGLIHAHFGNRGVTALPLAAKIDVPLITSFYGRDLAPRRGYRRLFDRGAAFLAEGPYAAERLIRLGAPTHRVHMHRLGVDPGSIGYRERRLGQSQRPRVLMTGRFVEKKGMPYGLEAFGRFSRAGFDAELTIVGDADSSADQRRIKKRLERLVRRYDIRERVRFTGFVGPEELARLIDVHHLLLQPSVWARDGDSEGGHPAILTQAAATGMPIIATRHCDIPEIVIDGQTGWLVAERDIDQIAVALSDAATRPEKLVSFGRRARALVEEKYDATCNTLDFIYDRVLG